MSGKLGRKWIPLTLAALMLAPAALLAERRVRVGVSVGSGGPAVHGRVVYRPVYHHRYYVRPYYGVGYYAGPRVVQVRRVNYGSVDFNIEPQNSQVFVNGAYLGIADDFNGYPQTAKLPAGYHTVRAVAPDGREIERRIYVAAGEELNFNWKF